MGHDRWTIRGGGGGFTLLELLVVLAIIALLVAIVLPALGKARDMAMLAKCSSNLRQQGIAMYGYINDSRDYIPYAAWWDDSNFQASATFISWDDLIDPYLEGKRSVIDRKSLYVVALRGSEVLHCDADPLVDDPMPMDAAVRSYSMPRSADATGTRGVGDISMDGAASPPQQFRMGVDLPMASATFMIVERSARRKFVSANNSQGCVWFAEIDRAEQQLPDVSFGDTFDASAKGTSQRIHGSRSRPLNNYLYCDGHVQMWTPAATIGTAASADAPAGGAWTRLAGD